MADVPSQGWPKINDEVAIEAGHKSWMHWIDHLERHTKAGDPRTHRRKICGARIPKGTEGRSDVDTPCCLTAGAPSTGSSPKDTGHKGFGRCGSHGGLSLVDFENPRSKYAISGRLGELEKIHETDMAVRKDIAMLELMVAADLERLPEDVLTPKVLSKALESLSQEITAADLSGSFGKVKRMSDGLREAMDEATLYWGVMDQIRKNMDLRRKMIDTHVRQMAREHGPVNWYDVAMIMEEMRRDVRQIIDEFIQDPVARSQAIKLLQTQTERTRGGPGLAIVP